MGESGVGAFAGVDPQGKGLYIQFERDGSSRYVYIGPEYVSELTGTVLRPHKITKLRKKNGDKRSKKEIPKAKKKIRRSK